MNKMKAIKENIEQFCFDHHWSHRRFCIECGIGMATLSRIMNRPNQKGVSMQVLDAILSTTGMTYEELTTRREEDGEHGTESRDNQECISV